MTDSDRRSVAIVGGGPAGLMAAEVLSANPTCDVTIYDAMPSVGRKFLMAGRGGLNLTHSEPLDRFVTRYRERAETLRPLLHVWSPEDVRQWCEGLGQETFVGSSGRVFPKIMKASGLLRAWLRRLADAGVQLKTRHRWIGWDDDGGLTFDTAEGRVSIAADAAVLALGGASWPRLGADGSWLPMLAEQGIDVAPWQPANAGFVVDWSDVFRKRFEGHPLKSIAIGIGDETARGEAMMTAAGIEGGAVYAISAALRDAVAAHGTATAMLDLKPDVDEQTLASQLDQPRGKQSMATFLRKKVRLSPVAIGLLQEVAHGAGRPLGGLSPKEFAKAIKGVPLSISGVSSIDRAISSAGGVRFDAIDHRFMLTEKPGVFVAGEMLDWEAPTGGYLLQACLATGVAAGRGVSDWLDVTRD